MSDFIQQPLGPTSPLAALLALGMALSACWLLSKRFGVPPLQGRFATIDGLRGYLAFFVFLSHGCVWYFYLRSGRWQVPPSNLYTHFGQSSVTLFFMITGFLFFSKILDARKKPLDWGRLFVSRALRLCPLYLLFFVLFLVLIAYATGWTAQHPWPRLFKDALSWLGFTLLGMPRLNGVDGHELASIGGVAWTLAYEWFFYLSLPLLALTAGLRPPLAYLLLSGAAALSFYFWGAQPHHIGAFGGGIAAAVLARSEGFRRFAGTTLSSFIVLACLGTAIVFFPGAYRIPVLLLLAIAFALIACGNSVFGILIRPVSRVLGEFAYSVYLLHSLLLFSVFNFFVGIAEAREFSPTTHWLLISALAPVLVLLCFLSFKRVEQPAMRSVDRVTAALRRRFPL